MSKQIYDELVEAGAPVLAEGLFYRVRGPNGLTGHVQVEIRRRLPLGFSASFAQGRRRNFWPTEDKWSHMTVLQVTALACVQLHDSIKQDIINERRLSEARRLAGDHP